MKRCRPPNLSASQWRQRRVGDLQQLLPEVLAREESDERFWSVLEAVSDVLLLFQNAALVPLSELSDGFGKAVGVVEDDKALHPRALQREIEVVGRARWRSRAVVLRNRTAEHDASLEVD